MKYQIVQRLEGVQKTWNMKYVPWWVMDGSRGVCCFRNREDAERCAAQMEQSNSETFDSRIERK